MILLPEMIPAAPVPMPTLDDALFPTLPADAVDDSPGVPFDSPRRVAARKALEALQTAMLSDPTLPPVETSVRTEFSERHEVFGAHMAVRTTSAPAGAVVIGAVHKYPTLNVLLKGKILMVTEHGRRVVTAPCMYMQAPLTKKASWVLEDCELTNVIMTPNAPTDELEADAAVRAFHTVPSYNDLPACATPADHVRIEG